MQLFRAPDTLVKTDLSFTFPPTESEPVWNNLLERRHLRFGLLPAGLGARNTLRLEARMLLYGNDMDGTTTLLEAGLGWIVKFDKGDFIGRDALLKQKQDGVRRQIGGFRNARKRYCARPLSSLRSRP